MTTVNGTSGAGPIWPQNNKIPAQPQKTEQTNIAEPIKLVSNESVGRTDLDKISPYAAMGVSISNPSFTARVEEEAQAMFPGHKGYFKLSNPEEALKDLIKIQLQTPSGVKQFVADHLNGNPKDVAAHIADKNGTFAELFA